MKNFKKKELKISNGITLIALVITIIILLILAGISIQMLTGENGVLNMLGKSSTTSDIKQVEELANLEVLDNLIGVKTVKESEKDIAGILEVLKNKGEIEGYGQTGQTIITGMSFGSAIEQDGLTLYLGGTEDIIKTVTFTSSDPSQDYYVQIKGRKYPIEKRNGKVIITPTEITIGDNPTGEITSVYSSNESFIKVEKVEGTTDKIKLKVIASGTANITVKYTEEIKTSFQATVQGIDPNAGFGAVNDAYKASFGKIVSGYNKSGTWRLFYADSYSAYLIRNSIGNYALNNLPGYGTSMISELGKNLNSRYTRWNTLTNISQYNTNEKRVAALLDTTKWVNYAAEGVATWAIGAPTLEMFIASYNATHTIRLDCKVDSSKAIGYKAGKNTSGGAVTSYSGYVDFIGNSTALDRAIYGPSSGYWWLASPWAGSSEKVVHLVSYDGGALEGNYSNNSDIAVRPLVSVPITKIGNGITITNSY